MHAYIHKYTHTHTHIQEHTYINIYIHTYNRHFRARLARHAHTSMRRYATARRPPGQTPSDLRANFPGQRYR